MPTPPTFGVWATENLFSCKVPDDLSAPFGVTRSIRLPAWFVVLVGISLNEKFLLDMGLIAPFGVKPATELRGLPS